MSLFGKILDLPFNLIDNFKLFPVNVAIKLPIYFSRNMKNVKAAKGSIKFKRAVRRNSVELGRNGTGFISPNRGYIEIDKGGTITFGENVTIAEGCRIYVSGGDLEIGDNVYINRNLTLQCEKKIVIEENALLGWNISIRDTDGHKVISDGEITDSSDAIKIGKRTWLAADVTILKGSEISDESIVACNSVVLGNKFTDKKILIAGYPAKEKKRKVERIS